MIVDGKGFGVIAARRTEQRDVGDSAEERLVHRGAEGGAADHVAMIVDGEDDRVIALGKEFLATRDEVRPEGGSAAEMTGREAVFVNGVEGSIISASTE